jgi:uncharacterized protein (TIGR03118 family)
VTALGLGAVVLAVCPGIGGTAFAQNYKETDLVSDQAGQARRTDSNLVNSWGLALGPTSPIWVANNGTGTSTLYDAKGRPFPKGSPLVVSIPAAPSNEEGPKPTGIVFNGTTDFVITSGDASGPSLFIFAGEDGTISGWRPDVDATHAILVADRSANEAVYKGLAIVNDGTSNFLFVTDFHNNAVDVYDASFTYLRSFTDPDIDAGYAPFGIASINGQVFVTFAKQLAPDNEDDDPGPGHGFVDVFDTGGALVTRFASMGTLDSPWAVVLAPANFGAASGDILVGNFGDGRINAFKPDGTVDGQLMGKGGQPLTIDGLWGLAFGNGTKNGGKTNVLFFAAGPDDENHGLFGYIKAK